MSARQTSIRDALYEAPGPRAKRRIRVGTAIAVALLAAVLFLIVRQFQRTGQLSPRYWRFFAKWTTWRFLLSGLAVTLQVALVAAVIAFSLGFLLMRCRLSAHAWLRGAAVALIEFTRGVPTLLFIYFFFLVAPQLGWRLSAFMKITLPVALSACGVVSEVLRSGVNAVPRGQREAALCLGMSERRLFYRIVFPQAFRYVIPTLIAELVIVLKDTTFAYIVSCADLMQNARVLISNYDALLSVYLVVAVLYILINAALGRVSDALAARQGRPGRAAEGGTL